VFGSELSCLVVVGAQWGDEGKGKLVDVLAEEADVVVRYQGGANAGHTVVVGDSRFILRLIPSGILNSHAVCVLGNGVVVDPAALFEELDALGGRGISTEGRLLISDRAHLVMPYHKLLDQAGEMSQHIGTTGRGIGPTYEDKYGRRGVRVADLRDLSDAERMLADRIGRVNDLLALAGMTERASVEEHAALLRAMAPRMLPLTTDTGHYIYQALRAGRRVLLEGASGRPAGRGPRHISFRHLVQYHGGRRQRRRRHRAHDDRRRARRGESLYHAGGQRAAPDAGESRRRGATPPGRRRIRVGDRAAPAVRLVRCDGGPLRRPGQRAHGPGRHQAGCPRRLRTDRGGYRIRGGREGSGGDAGGGECAGPGPPVYETLPGWRTPTGGALTLSDLPRAARTYLDRLEALAGVEVRYVSVGTRRDQIIDCRG
jgi:adenylosuccinate synthase